jgi:V/A-type H+-transporting ATPase subunit I
MRWREAMRPLGMQRVALLAPRDTLRDLLVSVADEGTVELETVTQENSLGVPTPASLRLHRLGADATGAAVAATAPDLDSCERDGRIDLIAGEAQLEQRSADAINRGSVTSFVGWMPSDDVRQLTERLARIGAAVVPLPRPSGGEPPTLLPQSGAAREFAPLVETYATVPYSDLNPSLVAGFAYVAMFGMMFADVGHGALLVVGAVAIRMNWWSRLASLHKVWLFVAGAGAASIVFGLLYGEFFGPTHVVPVVWLSPLDNPVALLGAAVAVGAVLLAGAYALGSVNRLREGGWQRAAYAPSGLAGATLFLGLGVVAAGVYARIGWLTVVGGLVAIVGLAASYAGLFVSAGGGGAGAAQAGIQLFDLVVRLGANLVSFARLAAFGLTHAALAGVVWLAAVSAWNRGGFGIPAAIAIFVIGTTLAFSLEVLVAGIQALRLEYYELFSRIFDSEGRPFQPWHVPLGKTEVAC